MAKQDKKIEVTAEEMAAAEAAIAAVRGTAATEAAAAEAAAATAAAKKAEDDKKKPDGTGDQSKAGKKADDAPEDETPEEKKKREQREKEEEDEEAKKSKKASGDERGRIAAILDAPEAKGREDLARHFALNTEFSVEACVSAMKKAPTQAESAAGGFRSEMAGIKNPDVASVETGGGGEKKSLVQQALEVGAMFGHTAAPAKA
jgi:flagellar motor protein MotB